MILVLHPVLLERLDGCQMMPLAAHLLGETVGSVVEDVSGPSDLK